MSKQDNHLAKAIVNLIQYSTEFKCDFDDTQLDEQQIRFTSYEPMSTANLEGVRDVFRAVRPFITFADRWFCCHFFSPSGLHVCMSDGSFRDPDGGPDTDPDCTPVWTHEEYFAEFGERSDLPLPEDCRDPIYWKASLDRNKG